MLNLHSYFKQRKERLALNKLHQVLRSTEITAQKKLDLIPAMTFWIMGFKDAMEKVRYEHPQSDIEKSVNVHGEEDSFHWKWFLKDLEILNQAVLKKSNTDLLAWLYQDELWPVRDMVYTVFRYIKQYESPIFRIMLIEALETGYGLFAEDMTPVIEEAGMYEKLEFFGKVHNDAEADHEMEDIADEEKNMEKLLASLTEKELIELKSLLEVVFDGLDKMHSCFAEYALN